MTDNVVRFPGWTRQPLPVRDVLENTNADALSYVLVLGVTNDGRLYAGSSEADVGRSLLVAQRFVAKMIAGEFCEVPE